MYKRQAGWILELDRGEGIPWKGNYSSWLEQKTKRMEMEMCIRDRFSGLEPVAELIMLVLAQ